MNNEELKNYVDSIEAKMAQRFSKLESEQVSQLHQHTGFDGNKIRFLDLDTIFYKTFTYNPASLVDGGGETIIATGVVGATLGDFVLVAPPYDLQGVIATGYVKENNVVHVRLQNESGITVDLASGLWRVLVIRKVL